MNLNEMQFEILPSEAAASGLTFGIGQDVSVDDGGFDPGSTDWSTQDGQSPTRGTTNFGRDVMLGPTWAWSMHVNREDTSGALETLGRIATAWRGREIADTPGAVLPIRYRMGDRVRRVYGRPRKFAAPPTNRILSGFVPIQTDFKCVDAFTYDDEISSAVIPANVSNTKTGFLFPLVFPTTALAPESREGAVTVLGDASAYPVIRFEGPISNPFLQSEDWKLSLKLTLGPTDYVEVDTRPWHMTALKNGTTSVAGALGRRQWLSDVKLEPGNQSLAFGGSASSGGATCTVSWRNTYNSL